MSGSPAPAVLVDARGLRCPLPVLRLAQALADPGLAPGSLVRLLATDPAARTDVPAFARIRGLTLAAVHDEGEHTAYDLRAGQPGGAGPVSAGPVSARPPAAAPPPPD